MAEELVEQTIDAKALIEASQERNMPLEKIVKEEGKKITFWNRSRYYRQVEDAIYQEILNCTETLKTIPPNEKAYSVTMQNLSVWTTAYTSLTKNKTDKWKTGLTVAGSILGTLLVCGFEKRGNVFIGKGLSTIIKPKQ